MPTYIDDNDPGPVYIENAILSGRALRTPHGYLILKEEEELAESSKPSAGGGFSKSDAKKFPYGKTVGGPKKGRLGSDSSRSGAGRRSPKGLGNRQSN